MSGVFLKGAIDRDLCGGSSSREWGGFHNLAGETFFHGYVSKVLKRIFGYTNSDATG